jgi:1,4-alpha-glucan branching enzyme
MDPRLYLAFMYTQPGKKLLFMGGEFAQEREWNHDKGLDWHLLEDPAHRGLQRLVARLNRLYRCLPALHDFDCEAPGFEWIDCNDVEQCVICYLRLARNRQEHVIVICNFTPAVRHDYRIGVPTAGPLIERLNTDARKYGGSGVSNGAPMQPETVPWHGRPFSIALTLPPLALVMVALGTEPVPADGKNAQ